MRKFTYIVKSTWRHIADMMKYAIIINGPGVFVFRNQGTKTELIVQTSLKV